MCFFWMVFVCLWLVSFLFAHCVRLFWTERAYYQKASIFVLCHDEYMLN